ncbi:hypothetical protein HMI55_007139 [Coelomomyces lativittatus]|nr:hypothetical protein HMI56_001070 [Coelomomyces lativittatus]KAJ1518318.1 hypothetical protein HMI55_007139 [Coelomomyces lativittatus]
MIQTSPERKKEIDPVPEIPIQSTSVLTTVSEDMVNKLQSTLEQLTHFLQNPPKQELSSTPPIPPPQWVETLQELSKQPQSMLKEFKELKQQLTKKSLDPMPTIVALEKEMEKIRQHELQLVEEIRCLKEEVRSKEKTREQIEKDKKVLENDLENKAKQLEITETKLEKVKSQSQAQLMKVIKELEKVTTESECMHQQLQEYEQSKDLSQKQRVLFQQKYKEKLKWERHESTEKERKIQSLTQELRLLQERERINSLHLNFRDLSIESKNARDQQWLQNHAQDSEKSRQRISELEKNLQDSETRSKQTEAQLQSQIYASQSQLASIQTKYNEQHTKCTQLEAQLTSTLQQRDHLTQLVQKQQTKLHDLNEQLGQLEQQYEEENLQLHLQLKQAQTKANDERQSLLVQLEETRQSAKQSQETWESEKQKFKELWEEEKKLRAVLKDDMEMDTKKLHAQLTIKEKMLEDQNNTIKHLKLNLTSKVNEFQTISKEIEAYKELQYELQLRDQEVNRLDSLLHGYKEDRDSLQVQLEHTLNKLDERNDSITQIEKEAMKLQSLFQKKLDQMETKHAQQLQDQVNKMEAMQIHLNHTLSKNSQRENELEHCRVQLKEQQVELEKQFQSKIQEQQNELQAWKEKYFCIQSKWQSISELVGSSTSCVASLAPVQ